MFKLQKRVFYANNIEDLKKIERTKNFREWCNCVDYYSILERKEDVLRLLNEKKWKKLTNSKIQLLNYLKFLYFLSNDDNFGMDRLQNMMLKGKKYNNKNIFEILRSKNGAKQLEIFDKNIFSLINNKSNRKKYLGIFEQLYLLNFNRIENINRSKTFEKRYIRKIEKIKKRKNNSILDIIFFDKTLYLSSPIYAFNNICNSNHFLNFKIILHIAEKQIIMLEKYKDILNDKIKKYNDNVVIGLRLAISDPNLNDLDRKSISNNIFRFIDENNVSYQNKIFNKINPIEETDKLIDYEDIIYEIVNNEEVCNDLLDVISRYMMTATNMQEMQKILKVIETISLNCEKEYYKKDFDVALNLLRFWSGDKADISIIRDDIYLPEWLTLLYKFDKGIIDYDKFLNSLDGCETIEPISIHCWDRLDKAFKGKEDLKWLNKIITKLNFPANNFKFRKYILNLYIKIINGDKQIFLHDYVNLDKTVFNCNLNEPLFYYYEVIIYLNNFRYSDENVEKVINMILQDYLDIKNIIGVKNFKNLFYMILYYQVEMIKNISLNRKIIDVLKSVFTNDEFNIILYYLSFIDETISLKYDDILWSAFEYYKNINDIDSKIYRIFANIANEEMIHKSKNNSWMKDIIYFDETGKIVVPESEYNFNIKEIYDSFGIYKSEIINKEKSGKLLELISARIFFARIEQEGLGKQISISEKEDGKEILKKLSDAIGYDDDMKYVQQIREGNIINDNLWMNVYTLHRYFKDVQKASSNIFKNSYVYCLCDEKAIVHITSLILLSKIGLAFIVAKYDNCFITSCIYDEIEKNATNNIIDYADGLVEEKVCYDNLVEDIYKQVKIMKNKKRVINVTKGNILSSETFDRMNIYDQEFFKAMIESVKNQKKVYLITEDTFYYNNAPFNIYSQSVYALIITALQKKIITSKQLLDATKKLNELGYNTKISNTLYDFLIKNSDDLNIKEIIKIYNSMFL